jgi:hypothetical protein
MDKTKTLSVRIEPPLAKWLARVARVRRISEGQVVRDLLWAAYDADTAKTPPQAVQA